MLNELWDTSAEWVERSGNYQFTIDGASYFAKVSKDSEFFMDIFGGRNRHTGDGVVYSTFVAKLKSNGEYNAFDKRFFQAYEFAFGFDMERGKASTAFEINRGDGGKKANVIKVLSTITNIFEHAVLSNGKPPVVFFSGEGKRIKVYDKLVKHLAKIVGYKYMITSTALFGNVYILYRL
jgi:hypothetical protein